jgi:hypothetical protein
MWDSERSACRPDVKEDTPGAKDFMNQTLLAKECSDLNKNSDGSYHSDGYVAGVFCLHHGTTLALDFDSHIYVICGIAFRHYYRSLAKSAGKDFRDGAVVPFE